MWKTFVYSISLLLLLNCSPDQVYAQDTIQAHSPDTILIPLKIRVGLEVSGPAIHYSDKNILNEEAYVSVDLDEKHSAFLAVGYLNYKYSQYNYSYLNHGSFVRIGMDFNLLKADKSLGKYWAGIGLRYGLSRFISETPSFEKEDYWGTTSSSIPQKISWGHFIEASPGVRAEIFNHFSIGWSVSLRMLLHSGTGKDLRPVYFPGFGDGTKTITTGMSYYIVWNIPYKKINVILKKPPPEEPENTEDNSEKSKTDTSGSRGNRQQGSGIKY
jgi:Domain of unknown function (DUF6048)